MEMNAGCGKDGKVWKRRQGGEEEAWSGRKGRRMIGCRAWERKEGTGEEAEFRSGGNMWKKRQDAGGVAGSGERECLV